MTTARTPLRVLLAVVTSVLLAASATAISRLRAEEPVQLALPAPSPEESAPGGGASAPPSPAPGPTRSPVPGPLPEDPDRAERLGADALLAAGSATARTGWAELTGGDWPVEERPVYVARVRLEQRRRISADLVLATRTTVARDELVLRLLPASAALVDAGTVVEVQVTRDGRELDATVDGEGARLIVPLDPVLTPGSAVALRVRLDYEVPDRRDIADDGGPAGFGLLAWNPEVTVLGHWLPLLTVDSDSGPMIPWGDVGAFPAAVWSVQIESDSTVITGGEESDCPSADRALPCTWARGVAVRDLSAVAYDAAAVEGRSVGPVRVNAVGPQGMAHVLDGALTVAADSVTSYVSRFGPLAWREIDVVAAPLSHGAAGMEFPGLLVIRDDTYETMDGGFGEIVVAHEVAHQWFHALVGNGSLSAPVVDESLAQYLAYLYVADVYGEQASGQLAADTFAGRYQRAREAGLQDEPPAQPLADFDGGDAYGPLVYGRAPLAWVVAEGSAGRDAVVDFLVLVVDRYALGFVSDDELLALAREHAPPVADALQRYWFDPAPIGP